MSSPYAAESASTSLKRTRHLFGAPVAVDDDARVRDLARRRRSREAAAEAGDAAKDQPSTMSTSLQIIPAASIENSRKDPPGSATTTTGALIVGTTTSARHDTTAASGTILTKRREGTKIPTPKWHSPWKLSTVLSSHLGWVRSIAVDPVHNTLFATGAADATIKIWNLPKACAGHEDALQYTLTGHISAVRGLAFSERHPYLLSCSEDKTVKCWDLETNQVVRHYHGHLSGVYCLALHPVLDILVTAGRDAVARVWDLRTKTALHVLSGHEHTIAAVLCNSTHPQVTTASIDQTIKLWDLAAGRCFTTLTHHSSAVRALAQPMYERTFASAAADGIRQWLGKNGKFLQSYPNDSIRSDSKQRRTVLNALAVQDDGVLVSGGDDGSLKFWDYATGHCFQSAKAPVQPGSLEAENGILALQFDCTGTRLITGESDKSIKIWKPDEEASELTHPINMKAWRKQCIERANQRY
jgi:pleiotropic regulator 1